MEKGEREMYILSSTSKLIIKYLAIHRKEKNKKSLRYLRKI